MIRLFENFRSSTPYKSGSFICCILSLTTLLFYSFFKTELCHGEAALLALPALFIITIIRHFTTWFFLLFNFIALIWTFLIKNKEFSANIFADISYFISLCSVIYFHYNLP